MFINICLAFHIVYFYFKHFFFFWFSGLAKLVTSQKTKTNDDRKMAHWLGYGIVRIMLICAKSAKPVLCQEVWSPQLANHSSNQPFEEQHVRNDCHLFLLRRTAGRNGGFV